MNYYIKKSIKDEFIEMELSRPLLQTKRGFGEEIPVKIRRVGFAAIFIDPVPSINKITTGWRGYAL